MIRLNRFNIYSRLYRFDKYGEKHRMLGWNMMLEPISEHITSHDLAEYLPEELEEYVESIKYYCCQGGYVCFSTKLKGDFLGDDIIEYKGQKKQIWKHVCDYLVGEISDGWGENGIYVIKDGWIGNPAVLCNCSTELYEPDYYESYRKAKRKGKNVNKFYKCGYFYDYPAFKQIKNF